MHACQTHQHCIDRALRKAESVCRARGVRLTDIRRKVLRIIWHSHDPAKAYHILGRLGSGASAKPPTVYRALDFLLRNGLAHKLDSLNSYVGCYHPLKHEQCYFLICEECGEVQECCDEKLSSAITNAASRKRFSPLRTTLEISGLCRHCSGA